MTREEAIEILRKNRPTSDTRPCGLELCDAVDMAISALRKQDHFREVTKKAEPLTMDELRQMDGEPVWCVSLGTKLSRGDGWYIGVNNWYMCGYGKTWLAYRQKPEEGTV